MAYRKKLSRGQSKGRFKSGLPSKKINHLPTKMGSRGGIRL